MDKYSWSFDDCAETWGNDTHNTIEECLEDARESIRNGSHWESYGYCDDPIVYIGENIEFVPSVSAYQVLEAIEEQASDECGECADGWESYDYQKRDEVQELSDMLGYVVCEWMKKYGYYPKMWVIDNIKSYSLQ